MLQPQNLLPHSNVLLSGLALEIILAVRCLVVAQSLSYQQSAIILVTGQKSICEGRVGHRCIRVGIPMENQSEILLFQSEA
jgi:hypothetical protein